MDPWRPATSRFPPTSPDQPLPGCQATARPLPCHWQATVRARHAFWPPYKRPLAGHLLVPSTHSGRPTSVLAARQAFWLPGKHCDCPACIRAARHAFWPPCKCSGCPTSTLAAHPAFWLPCKHSGCPTSILAARHAFWLLGTHSGCSAGIWSAWQDLWLPCMHSACKQINKICDKTLDKQLPLSLYVPPANARSQSLRRFKSMGQR